jgi:hypothetical protein
VNQRRTRFFLALTVSFVLSACGVATNTSTSPSQPVTSSSEPSSVRSPATTPATSPSATPSGAKCASLPLEPPYYFLVGWVGDRLAVIAETFPACSARYELRSVDPSVGTWRTENVFATAMPELGATDGRSIALPLDDGIVVVDASGKTHTVARPSGVASDWDAYGLPALPGGGYLVVGTERLLLVASDGTAMTSDPLPAGYVEVAPTSDPNRFVLAPTVDAHVEWGLSDRRPFHAYLWDRTAGTPKLIAGSVTGVQPAGSGTGLAFLTSKGANDTTTWLLLGHDGSVREVAKTSAAAWLSPDGKLAVTTRTPDRPSLETLVVDLRTGRVVVDVTSLAATGSAWNGDRVAILAQTQLPRTGEPAVFVVQGADSTRIPLP